MKIEELIEFNYGQAGRGLLFGKYEKTVWVPAHTRGDETKGKIEKGYEVELAKGIE